LTTFHEPLMEMGARAVQLLMKQIEATREAMASTQPAKEAFETALMVRATTAAPGRTSAGKA